MKIPKGYSRIHTSRDLWKIVSEAPLLCSAFPFHANVYFTDQQREWLMLVGAEAAVPKLVLAARWPPVVFKFVNIVDCSGVLLVLTNNVDYKKGSEEYTVEFGTFRLDAGGGGGDAGKAIGERAMFVRDYYGGLVVSFKGTVEPNAIYFQFDRFGSFLVCGVSGGNGR